MPFDRTPGLYNQDKFRNQKVKEHELTLEKNELKRLR